ncbi:TonB-dependent receptor domain-containing protein [Adhaeribacter rhizoryzae]|uniref:TonB-dependent receptor domain-containing protein n=1 Tax=Adhaeribacter rhizoryzae TaxID=2607907 RepID=UPI00167FE015|nr:TonB-dependent receptor [Adhaeribacter rhizoryzae]
MFSLQASGQTLINGQVQEESGKAFPFANVLLLSAHDSALVKGMLSGETGLYRFENVKPGPYLVSISAVGYKQTYSKTFTIHSEKQVIQLNTLVLAGRTRELQEVSVTEKKPLLEQHLDRLVVNVQNSITAAGGTALDVLERAPGVNVNRQQNSIAMSGKTGVVVMVNGKISRLPTEAVMQMLNSMQAGNIEKIELITTPSAQYDAEGNAGIINIVLSKSQNMGTNGSYSGNVGHGWYEKAGASANLNHRTRKLNLFGDAAFSYDHFMFQIQNNRRVVNQGQLKESNTHSKRYSYQASYNSRFGFDYTPNPKTTIGGLVSGFNNNWHQYCKNNAHIKHDQEVVTHVYMQDHEINHWRNLMGNLNLQHVFNSDQSINIDLDYLFYHHSNPHWYENDYNYFNENSQAQEQMNNSKLTPIHMWVGKADFSTVLSKDSKLETGLKGTTSRLNNKVEFNRLINENWQIDPELGQNVKMLENIGAAYVNFSHQLNAKTKLQTGLRWEFTYTNLTTVVDKENLINRRYHNLFPSIFITHELNPDHGLQFSYSRRITRPTFNDLAPFVNFWDPYSFVSGNDKLRPTLTNALQASYQLKKQYLLSFQYSHDYNAISWAIRVDPEKNVQFTTKENIRDADTYSVNLNFPAKINAWWQMQNNLMVNWQQNKTNYQGEEIKISGRYGQVNTTQSFTLPKGITFELAYFFQTRAPMGIGYHKPTGYFNAGIQKKLKNDKGTFRLTGSDLFWTRRLAFVNRNPALNQDVDLTVRFEPRVFRLIYTRNFGNKYLKVLNRRNTGSEEERKRVN